MLIHPSIEVFKLTETSVKEITLTAYIAGTAEDMPFNYKRKAVLICPGGAYSFCSNREAEPIATCFLAAGYNAFVLDYSVKNRENPGKKFPGQLIEAALAMKFIKDNADKFNIDPNYVFVSGYSAGGHLAASLGILYNSKYVTDAIDMPENYARPAGMVLAYPVITSGEKAHSGSFNNLLGDKKDDKAMLEFLSLEKQVSEDTPPTFLWHTFADSCVPVENSLMFANALKANNIPFEMHIYPEGQHGLSTATKEVCQRSSIYPHVTTWTTLVCQWLDTIFKTDSMIVD